MNIHAWLVLLPALILLSSIPGPNNLVTAANGLRLGMSRAAAAVSGRILAFVVMMTVTVLGLGTLLETSKIAFEIVKWFSVSYLVLLGIQTWRAPPLRGIIRNNGPAQRNMQSLFQKELMLAAGNPKAILIFTAVFPQFVDRMLPAFPQLVVIGLTFLVTEWSVATCYAIIGSRLGLFPISAKRERRPNKVVGALFVSAAGLVAAARPGLMLPFGMPGASSRRANARIRTTLRAMTACMGQSRRHLV